MIIRTRGRLLFAFAMAAAVLGAALVSLVLVQPAAATVQFATETGKSCGDCHTNAAGGGPLTPFGQKFKENGNKLPK
jgi:mono/diheme cytochrome c family protein